MLERKYACPWCHGDLKYICYTNDWDINSSHYACDECHVYIRKDNYNIYTGEL